ncbi:MAG: 2-oxo acid dehydrogenase subunit E2 [Candidatus Bathyarchaeota archaeon]|nr:2-oxo acid dehydrogenase subunit E2 [Candidatus Bathyarchaeota archaeon]
MPRLSLTMKTGSVIQWFKKEGERVEKGEPLLEVLSDKVTYDVEAPASGVLRRILADEGNDFPVDTTLGLLTAPDEDLSDTEIEIHRAPFLDRELQESLTSPREMASQAGRRVLASPAAKKIAREHNADLSLIQGTGPEGRIVREDVEDFVQRSDHRIVKEEIPLVGIRKTTAERVTSSFQTAPHSFIVMDVDITEASKVRERTKSSYTAILVHAAVKALAKHPGVNASLVDAKIRVFTDINVGIAVSTAKGLVVPVIKNAQEKTLSELSSELGELVKKAREGSLSREQMEGGTFTVTNLGMYDVNLFIPIINPPEAAILAAGRIIEKPIVAGGKVIVKPIMTLTLAYDHRILDGAPAALFLKEIKTEIQSPEEL